ncbi:MAG: 3-hydroxyacyl-CoA dehydrogenase family protein [Pontibacterium sp.]
METSNAMNISIIGAGLMGQGIALTCLRAGHRVSVYDPSADAIASLSGRVATGLAALGESAAAIERMLKNLFPSLSLKPCVEHADFVTEAVPEKLELKQRIFAEVESYVSRECVLASNTSVIPITKIMSGLVYKDRALGTHWWNPAHLIPLVEVVKTADTSELAMDFTVELLAGIGKTPVRVEKDVPGFIGNRLQHALWREAVSLVEHGVCDAAAVDTVIKSSFGRRLAVLGPLENADLVGTDLTQDIHSQVLYDLDASDRPSPYLDALVAQGKLGMKSGQGFYVWQDGDAAKIQRKVISHLTELQQVLEAD